MNGQGDQSIEDITELNNIWNDLQETHNELTLKSMELAKAQTPIFILKSECDTLKRYIKNLEEKIRIKKIEVINKPR